MPIPFIDVPVGAVVECQSGRRLVKADELVSDSDAFDADGNGYDVPADEPVTVLTTAEALGCAYICVMEARDASRERQRLDAARAKARELGEAAD